GVLLAFLEVTRAEPHGSLRGRGPRVRALTFWRWRAKLERLFQLEDKHREGSEPVPVWKRLVGRNRAARSPLILTCGPACPVVSLIGSVPGRDRRLVPDAHQATRGLPRSRRRVMNRCGGGVLVRSSGPRSPELVTRRCHEDPHRRRPTGPGTGPVSDPH